MRALCVLGPLGLCARDVLGLLFGGRWRGSLFRTKHRRRSSLTNRPQARQGVRIGGRARMRAGVGERLDPEAIAVRCLCIGLSRRLRVPYVGNGEGIAVAAYRDVVRGVVRLLWRRAKG